LRTQSLYIPEVFFISFLISDPKKTTFETQKENYDLQVLLCTGEVAGPHGHERDAADSRAQAAPQAPARQGVLPSRGRKVSCWIRAQHFREHFRQSEIFRVKNFSFLKSFFQFLLTTFVSYKVTKI
jgi:hypothetical protein